MATAPQKYKVEDKEILVAVYNKLLWRFLVPKIPRSITPNQITVFGQIAALLGLITGFAATQGMPFFYVVSGVLWFTYLTADNLDGQHARATGQASPLGEFLDHGLDGFASGCLLLTCSVVIGMDGIWMAMFLALGALGFIVTFWEQYRTGRLILPEISAAEGVTLVIVINFLQAFMGEPEWLQFGVENMTVATWIMFVVLAGYLSATFAPTLRIFKHTGKIGEILPVLAIGAASCGYVAAGAAGPMPAIMVSMFAGDVVCRMIRLRHQGEDALIVAPYHWIMVLPLIPAAIPGVWTADGWAVIAMGLSIVMYGATLIRGGSIIVETARQQQA